jgi:hypothetical protein
MSTTSKLGADMTNEQIWEAIEFCFTGDEARRMGLSLSLFAREIERRVVILGRQPAAIDKQEPVATLHDDGRYSWRGAKTHGFSYAGWRMEVYAAPLANEASKPAAPSVGQDERELIELLRNVCHYADSVCGMLRQGGWPGKAEALESRIKAVIDFDANSRDKETNLPCPICNGVEGCDHTVPERARAASTSANVAQQDEDQKMNTSDLISTEMDTPRRVVLTFRTAAAAEQFLATSNAANVVQGAEAVAIWRLVRANLNLIANSFANCKGSAATMQDLAKDCLTKVDAYLDAAPPAQTALTDDARECLADVVSHYRALYAGLAFQLNEATVNENSDDMTYWKHEIKALERMYAQAERALTAAQSASGDTK